MWHILILCSAFKNEIMHLQASLFRSLGRLGLRVGLWSLVGTLHALLWRLPFALCRARLLRCTQQGQAQVLLGQV